MTKISEYILYYLFYTNTSFNNSSNKRFRNNVIQLYMPNEYIYIYIFVIYKFYNPHVQGCLNLITQKSLVATVSPAHMFTGIVRVLHRAAYHFKDIYAALCSTRTIAVNMCARLSIATKSFCERYRLIFESLIMWSCSHMVSVIPNYLNYYQRIFMQP